MRNLRSIVTQAALLVADAVHGQREMEALDRGLVAVRQPAGKVFTGWRLLGTEPERTAFNLHRVAGGKAQRVNREPLAGATCRVVATACCGVRRDSPAGWRSRAAAGCTQSK